MPEVRKVEHAKVATSLLESALREAESQPGSAETLHALTAEAHRLRAELGKVCPHQEMVKDDCMARTSICTKCRFECHPCGIFDVSNNGECLQCGGRCRE